jgi:hypothetical protein
MSGLVRGGAVIVLLWVLWRICRQYSIKQILGAIILYVGCGVVLLMAWGWSLEGVMALERNGWTTKKTTDAVLGLIGPNGSIWMFVDVIFSLYCYWWIGTRICEPIGRWRERRWIRDGRPPRIGFRNVRGF